MVHAGMERFQMRSGRQESVLVNDPDGRRMGLFFANPDKPTPMNGIRY